MMRRVPRLHSGTFSQPAAKTLTSFCLHFGQTSSRLQSQWDLGGQRRRLLHVACKNSKSVDGGGGRGGRGRPGGGEGCAEGPQCSTGDVCRRGTYGFLWRSPASIQDLMRCARTHLEPGQHIFPHTLIYVPSQDHM